jgi:hypothetical protein
MNNTQSIVLLVEVGIIALAYVMRMLGVGRGA